MTSLHGYARLEDGPTGGAVVDPQTPAEGLHSIRESSQSQPSRVRTADPIVHDSRDNVSRIDTQADPRLVCRAVFGDVGESLRTHEVDSGLDRRCQATNRDVHVDGHGSARSQYGNGCCEATRTE